MIIYLAGAETYHKELGDANVKYILFSYYNLSKNLSECFSHYKEKPKVFLDSGAFSAYFSKAQIDIYDYIQFIKTNKHLLTTYANLDVIGNPKETAINQKIMEEEGLSPLPVWHFLREPIEVFEELCKKYDYVAIGGVSGFHISNKDLIRKLRYVFSKAGKTKIHGFGMTSSKIIKLLPFYSVDSTAWLMGNKFGTMYKYSKSNIKEEKLNNFNKLKWPDILKWNLTQWKKFADYMERRENAN